MRTRWHSRWTTLTGSQAPSGPWWSVLMGRFWTCHCNVSLPASNPHRHVDKNIEGKTKCRRNWCHWMKQLMETFTRIIFVYFSYLLNNKTTTSWLSVSNKSWDVWREVVPLDDRCWVLLPHSAFCLNRSPARTCNVLKSCCDWLRAAAAAASRLTSAAQMFQTAGHLIGRPARILGCRRKRWFVCLFWTEFVSFFLYFMMLKA